MAGELPVADLLVGGFECLTLVLKHESSKWVIREVAPSLMCKSMFKKGLNWTDCAMLRAVCMHTVVKVLDLLLVVRLNCGG